MKGRRLVLGLVRVAFFGASLAYLAYFAYRSFDFDDLRMWLSAGSMARLAGAALLFGGTAFFSIVGWRAILTALHHPIRLAEVAHVFCITQIAKYLPGNVGHHVGRVALARQLLGVPAGTALFSILQESALVCLAALVVSAISWMLASQVLPTLGDLLIPMTRVSVSSLLSLALALGLSAFVVVNLLRTRIDRTGSSWLTWIGKVTPSWSAAGTALPGYIAIYVMNGAALWLLTQAVQDWDFHDILVLTGAYSLSWTLGFLLPGAPGGLGVREATLTMILAGIYPPDVVLALSVMSRLASVIADVAIFVFGWMLRRQGNVDATSP